MNGFAGRLVQFAQIRKAQAADIELSYSSLPDGKTCNSKMMGAFRIAIQKSGRD